MKDKEKQIEEMAKTMRINICDNRNCKQCYYNGFGSNDDKYCKEYWYAKRLIDLGYRKIDKNSVVLSIKQCVEIVQDNYNLGYERGSKETAEKYFDMILTVIKELKSFETVDVKDILFLQEKK